MYKKIAVVGLLIFALFFSFSQVNAVDTFVDDVGFTGNDFFFSVPVPKLVEGTNVKLYARIWNYSGDDVTASVKFSMNGNQIGPLQNISLRAGGLADEVFTSLTVPSGAFSIRAEIVDTSSADVNVSNNVIEVKLITAQLDNDKDGIGNLDDPDNDNEGLTNDQEFQIGTDQFKADTDGDGVSDKNDAYPLDKTRWAVPPPVVKKPVVQKPLPPIEKANLTTMTKTETETAPVEVSADVPPTGPEVDPQKFFYSENLFSAVNIQAKNLSWGTYEFSFITDNANIKPTDLTYEWDFGDGVISQTNTVHHYSRPGDYIISLKVTGMFGEVLDTEKVSIPFWSVNNSFLTGGAALLVILIIFALYFLIKNKHEKADK